MKKNQIYTLYGKNIETMTEKLCFLAGLEDLILEKCGSLSARIVLKPNLLGPVPAEEGATTHPEIVEGVICYLKKHGFTDITVMEGSWVGDVTSDSLLVTGMGDLLERLKVPFVDLQKDPSAEVDCGGMKIRICRSPMQADFLINLPVMKGHCQTRMTCALKNMKGCLPNAEKRRFHRLGLFGPIGHLAAALRQDFILADSICSDLTFEDGGNPVQQDRIFAACDPVLCDAYCCSLMNIDISEVPYIGIAESCGAGSSDLTKAEVLVWHEEGRQYLPVNEPAGGFSSAEGSLSGDLIAVREIVNDVDSCSACYGTLIPVLNKLKEQGYDLSAIGRICIGQGYRGKSGRVGIGSCTSGFEKSLKGCPPKEEDMERFLLDLLGPVEN